MLDRLKMIELAKRSGFTIAEIRHLLHGFARSDPPGARWRAMAKKKLADLNRRIAEAESMKAVLEAMSECECPSFDECAEVLRQAARAR